VYAAVFTNTAGQNLVLDANAVGLTPVSFPTIAKPAGSGAGILLVKYTPNGGITWARLIEGGSSAII